MDFTKLDGLVPAVVQDEAGRICLSLDPKLKRDDEDYGIIVETPHRIAIVLFNDQHRKLHRILGGTLKVPAAAASKVIESIQCVASLVSVHSEIGHTEVGDSEVGDSEIGNSKSRTKGEKVKGSTQPHIHLQPYQSGLRIEFFVQGGRLVFVNRTIPAGTTTISSGATIKA